MWSIFVYAFQAIASISLLSIYGYWLKKTGALDDALSKRLNSLVFRYFMPLDLFLNVYEIESLSDLPLRQMLFCLLFTLTLFFLGTVVSPHFTADRRKQSVITQCFFRSNAAVIGIPVASLLGGEEAEHIAATFLAPSVILFNILAVICFTVYAPDAEDRKIDIPSLLSGILHNPLIRGLCAGLLCLVVRALLPKNADGLPIFSIQYSLPPVYQALSKIAQVASPMMLVLLGARFDFHAVSRDKSLIVLGVAVRDCAAPVLGYFALFFCSNVLHLFETTPVMYQGLIGILAAPCAISSAVMAAEMGGDDTLAGQLVVWSTLCSVGSLFVLILVLRSLQLM